jgi:hypothetical protein
MGIDHAVGRAASDQVFEPSLETAKEHVAVEFAAAVLPASEADAVAIGRAMVMRTFGRPTLVATGCRLEVAFDPARVGAYRMEYLDEAGKWATLHTGKTIGYRSQIRFPAVTAQKFRLVIEDGRTTPLISEIGLYWNPYDERKNPNDFKPGETETGTREEAAI